MLIMANQYIEIFLFLDPLGRRCNSARKIVKQFRLERPEKVKIRVIPMVNSRRVYGHARKKTLDNNARFVDKNNNLLANTYNACLAIHASAMQGRKKSHEYLTMLQEHVVEARIDFSNELAFEVAQKVGLDMEMFEEDFKSDLTKKIYRKNLRIASDMGVISTPSTVVYPHGEHTEGIRLGEEMEKEILHSICGIEEIKQVDDSEEIIEEVKQELKNIINLNTTV